MSETKEEYISLSEVAKHTSQDDMWVVINGKVYDVSKFIDEHPGGEEVITDIAGKDATREFEDVGHSEDAVEILERLYVGNADPKEVTITDAKLGVAENLDKMESGSSSFLYVLLALIVAAAAYYYTQVL